MKTNQAASIYTHLLQFCYQTTHLLIVGDPSTGSLSLSALSCHHEQILIVYLTVAPYLTIKFVDAPLPTLTSTL